MSAPDSPSPIRKVLLRALLLFGVSLVGFTALVPAALYVPENFLLRDSEGSKLAAFMLPSDALPEDMIFVSSSKADNEDVAKNYPDAEEMEQRLDGYGREEGYTRTYVSRDRCKQAGMRSIEFSVVRMKDAAGALPYQEWLRAKNYKEVDNHGPVEIGGGGYQLSGSMDVLCPPYEESYVAIHFLRDRFLGTAAVYVAKDSVDEEELQELALGLARQLDETIQRKAAAP